MRTRTVSLVALVALLTAAGCSRDAREGAPSVSSNPTPASPAPAAAAHDIHSYAVPAEARVTDVALNLDADFAAKRLSGTATLSVERAANAARLVLDTKDLEIEKVADGAGAPLQFTLGDADKVLGRALTITLPAGSGPLKIVVTYRTSPSAAALQWLSPEQTAGRKQPYLFSQGEAILTRTWIPTQDSPGIRQTYSAHIVVPKPLRAVMSAEHLTPEGVAAGDKVAFDFRLDKAIPPYLIALAVGDIRSKAISERTAVYAEPSVLDKAAYEFADLEKMVTAAEHLLGPYRWGRYDVLVLPPSFPFGGMENPRLTFATPTVIAGDRSLVSLIAHELAHSWSGNLVTNATWSEFWLNEGVTTYVENRIMEALYGADRARMLQVLQWQELQAEVTRLGGPASKETMLHLDLAGRDPDDGMTQIAYDKGASLLRTIAAAVGRERFDAYLRSYFDRHAFQPITSAAFLADVRANLFKGDAALDATLRLDDWVYKPGVPDNADVPTSDALARVGEQAAAFAKGGPASGVPTTGWSTQQWQHFLESMPASLTAAQLADLDRAFKLTASGNSEVLFDWLRIAIRHHYQPAMPALERFLTSQGRRKFLRPLYEDLMAQAWGKAEAKRIYATARPTYHSVATQTLDAIVK